MRLLQLHSSLGCALLLALSAFGGPTPSHAQNAPGMVLPEQLRGVWLVEGRVLSAQELGNATRSTVQITRVFSGPMVGSLLGQRVEVISTNEPGSGAMKIVPPPVQGQNGIWAVSRTGAGLKVELGQQAYGLRLPAREGVVAGDFSSYDDALQLGLAAEKIAKLGRADVEERLRGYALNDVPEISAWAIVALGTLLEPDSQEAFYKPLLEDAKVPLLGRLAVDTQLLRLDKAWRESPDRVAMLGRWIGEIQNRRAVADMSVWLSATDSVDEATRTKLKTELSAKEEAIVAGQGSMAQKL